MKLHGKSVFLSGPMSGLLHYNVEDFAKTHAIVKKAGAVRVYNPAIEYLQSTAKSHDHEYWMRRCLHELTVETVSFSFGDDEVETKSNYDVLVLLPGWMGSAGSQLEYTVATACGIEVCELSEVEA